MRSEGELAALADENLVIVALPGKVAGPGDEEGEDNYDDDDEDDEHPRVSLDRPAFRSLPGQEGPDRTINWARQYRSE